MMPMKFRRTGGRLFVALAASLAASGAFAGRYWRGATADGLFSDTENWSSESHSGAGGASKPGDGATSTTYFCKLKNGYIVFDEAATLPNNVLVGTQSDDYFVWRALDPSFGLGGDKELQIAASISSTDRTPSFLAIDGGTYSFSNTIIGYVNNARAGLRFNGGTYTGSNTTRIGYANGATAEMTLNGGSFTTLRARVGGGKTGVVGTLVVNGGTFRTTYAGDDTFMVCDQPGTTGTLILNGGVLDTTSGNNANIGGVANVTATIYVNTGGVWNAKGIFLGGKRMSTKYAVDNAVTRLFVNGGTLNLGSNPSGIGYAVGEGSLAEMVVNDGEVTVTGTDTFYVGESGPGSFTMNGGTFTMNTAANGFGFGHAQNGSDVGTVTLNGGVLAIYRIRLDYVQPGSRLVFNGGTLRAVAKTSNFIDANANLTCVVDEGGLVVDTAGFDITINHDIVEADGISAARLLKKGAGTLTVSGQNPFKAENIFVLEGKAVVGGTTYRGNGGTLLNASAGGDLGEVVLHDEPLESWLKDSDMATYTSKYGAAGTAALELPLDVAVNVNGKFRKYENLETGRRYEETFNGVTYSFTTESLAPRTLRVLSTASTSDGGKAIKNVRDVGSWPIVSVDGTKKMNQGVIFRGAKLDYFANTTAKEKSASWLAGLKTEVDLRQIGELNDGYKTLANMAEAGGKPKSWAAVDADYLFCPMTGTQISATESGNFTNQLHRMFSRLGTPGALPAYFHCLIGTDRTGITGLLLLGMMGVEEETLYRDYLMSNFANIGGSRSLEVPETFLRYMHRGNCNGDKYVYNTKDAQYGVSVASRCRQYLEMCGVTDTEIANITQALSGETPEQVLARVDAWEAANGVRTVSYIPYSGASVLAIHRLPAGQHIFPASEPTRSGYVFQGWDTANEADGVVYASWKKQPVRYWADANGEAESFVRAESWDPAPPEGAFDPDDILALNKGGDKVALLSAGDTAAVSTLHVGWGSLDGGTTFDKTYDRGGRLDVTGGTLAVSDILYVGSYRSTYSNNVVNVSGGRVEAGQLFVGTYASTNGKRDVLNVFGDGVVAVTSGEVRLATYQSGGSVAYLNIGEAGTLQSAGDVKFGTYGRAMVDLADDALLDLSGKDLYLANGGGTYGEVALGGAAKLRANDIWIGYSASSTGKVSVAESGFVTAGHYVYIGRKGCGELTVDGGEVRVSSVVQFGADGASGNATVLNLDGGKLSTRQMKVVGSPNAVFNWNGGTLECSTISSADGDMIPANARLEIRVLRGGAVYNAVVRNTEEIKHDLGGVGALVKTGGKELKLSGAVDLEGGFVVKGGKLTVKNLARTRVERISVASGAELDLNGADITAGTYLLDGVSQRAGTYTAHNGTIRVPVRFSVILR